MMRLWIVLLLATVALGQDEPLLHKIHVHSRTFGHNSLTMWTDLPSDVLQQYPELLVHEAEDTDVDPTDATVTLVHCDWLDTSWGSIFTVSPECYCYNMDHDVMNSEPLPLAITGCDVIIGKETSLYTSAAGIIRKGEWDHFAIFTDHASSSGQLQYASPALRTTTYSSCVTDGREIPDLVGDIFTRGDYANVVVDCPYQETLDVILKITSSYLWSRNINWLLLDITPEEFSKVRGSLRREESAASVYAALITVSTSQLFQTLFEGSHLKTTTTVVEWCFLDCPLDDAIITEYTEDDLFRLNLLPQYFQHFHGRHLTVTYMEYQPFCFWETYDGDKTRLAGVEVSIVQTLSEVYNFSYSLVRSFDGVYGSKTDEGEWTGMVAMLVKNQADIAISGIFLQSTRDQVIDYLLAHYEDPTVVAIDTEYVKWFYFIRPFSFPVWLTLAFVPLLVTIVMVIIKFVEQDLWKPEKDPKKLTRKYGRCFNKYILKYYSATMFQAEDFPEKSWPTRILIFSLWFMAILTTGVYTGNLTAALAIPVTSLPFTTLQELVDNDIYTLQVIDGTVAYQLLIDGQTEIYRQLWAKVSVNKDDAIVPSAAAGYGKLAMGKYALAYDRIELLNFMVGCGKPCENFVYVPEYYNKAAMGMLVKERIPYKRKFDDTIALLLQSGIVNQWADFYMAKLKKDESRKIDPVTVKDVSLMLEVLIGYGLGVSFSVLLLENVLYWACWLCRRYGSKDRAGGPYAYKYVTLGSYAYN